MNPVEYLRAVLDFVREIVKGQPFSNVIAIMQLVLLAGAVWLAVFQLVPAERQAILDGMLKQEGQQTIQIEQITNSFERALDRYGDGSGSGSDPSRRSAVADKE